MCHADAQLMARGNHGLACEMVHQTLSCARVSESQEGVALFAHDPDLVNLPKLREDAVYVLILVVGWQVSHKKGGCFTAGFDRSLEYSRRCWAGEMP